MSEDDDKPLDPEAAKIVAKVRRLMMIASATTFVAVAVVLMVIGYRLFNVKESGRPDDGPPQFADVTTSLPVGAKVLVLGITFKEDCPDIRNTRVIDIVRGLRPFGSRPGPRFGDRGHVHAGGAAHYSRRLHPPASRALRPAG